MKNRSALITGGARRIGKAITLAIADAGYDIALHYNHSIDHAKRVEQAVTDSGHSCKLYQCDLADAVAVESMITTVCSDFPDLSLVVNNASIFEESDLRHTDRELYERTMAINLQAPFIISREYANLVKHGHIINMVDATIHTNNYRYSAYYLSKKSLTEMTRMNARELGPAIRVNAVAPGIILPPPDQGDQYIQPLIKSIPLQRQGSVDDIVKAVKFLIENEYITGQIIYVDGGRHL